MNGTIVQLGGVVKRVVEKSLEDQLRPVFGDQENILQEIRDIREYIEGPLETHFNDMTQLKKDITEIKENVEKIRDWMETAIARNALAEAVTATKQ